MTDTPYRVSTQHTEPDRAVYSVEGPDGWERFCRTKQGAKELARRLNQVHEDYMTVRDYLAAQARVNRVKPAEDRAGTVWTMIGEHADTVIEIVRKHEGETA